MKGIRPRISRIVCTARAFGGQSAVDGRRDADLWPADSVNQPPPQLQEAAVDAAAGGCWLLLCKRCKHLRGAAVSSLIASEPRAIKSAANTPTRRLGRIETQMAPTEILGNWGAFQSPQQTQAHAPRPLPSPPSLFMSRVVARRQQSLLCTATQRRGSLSSAKKRETGAAAAERSVDGENAGHVALERCRWAMHRPNFRASWSVF